jgi:hypothetical protein
MDVIVNDKPNLAPETVPVKEASTGLDAIAAKMAAMRNIAERNRPQQPEHAGTGSSPVATEERPVAPEAVNVDSDTDLVEPEIATTEAQDEQGTDEAVAPEEVSTGDSTQADIIDFLEFAEENPNAKFRFKRNGKTIEIDAKKAAAILGQGAAISEDARQLKVERAEFDEYLNNKRAETEGLLLAMEFTVRPQLQQAYDEIVKTQGYQATFQQQLQQTRDPAQIARIQAAMQQNERYIQQQSQQIRELKPKVDQFYDMRRGQVQQVLEDSRKNFKDKELKNQYVYNEIRDKVAQGWEGARRQLVPGIDNIDLISSDEHLLSLLRDGLKFRDRPKTKPASGSIAALTQRKGSSAITVRGRDDLSDLQEKAKAGDRNAQDNLLVAKMNALRQQRLGR